MGSNPTLSATPSLTLSRVGSGGLQANARLSARSARIPALSERRVEGLALAQSSARVVFRLRATRVKAPKHKSTPTLPFSADEMKRILEACDRYPGNADRMKAFVLTMRHSGLRIGDTIALKRERVKGNKLFLYTQKTGTPVYVPLPPAAVEALGKLNGDSEHFFTSGKAKPQTARANRSRYLDTVFELAKVKDAHSHRFRDTFAVSLLENGVSIENVSVLLGHSSVRITERHYKPWVKTLQKKLEDEVRKAWA